MDKERFRAIQNESIYGDKAKHDFKPYTKEEFDEGYHYCVDWDFLFIAPLSGSEWDSCCCHPLKKVVKESN